MICVWYSWKRILYVDVIRSYIIDKILGTFAEGEELGSFASDVPHFGHNYHIDIFASHGRRRFLATELGAKGGDHLLHCLS